MRERPLPVPGRFGGPGELRQAGSEGTHKLEGNLSRAPGAEGAGSVRRRARAARTPRLAKGRQPALGAAHGRRCRHPHRLLGPVARGGDARGRRMEAQAPHLRVDPVHAFGPEALPAAEGDGEGHRGPRAVVDPVRHEGRDIDPAAGIKPEHLAVGRQRRQVAVPTAVVAVKLPPLHLDGGEGADVHVLVPADLEQEVVLGIEVDRGDRIRRRQEQEGLALQGGPAPLGRKDSAWSRQRSRSAL